MTSGNAPNPAEIYDQYFGPAMFIPSSKALLEQAAPSAGQRVIDLACGSGIVTELIANAVGSEGSVVGLDFSPPMLGVASGKQMSGAPVEWVEADVTAIPFPDSSFDLAVCQHGVQFFPDPLACATEVKRVLKPGGRFAFTVWGDPNQHPLMGAMFRSISERLGVPFEATAKPFMFGPLADLVSLLGNAGYREIQEETRSFDATFPSADRWVQMTVMGAAAAIPAFRDLSADDRDALIPGVASDVGDMIKDYTYGDSVVFTMTSHYATGIA
jgi:ubiquinone/menaquinone biosynthesis C-methylase UbiE